MVGESIAALVNMFNPGTIVIGGAVVGAGEVFLAEVRQRVYELSLPLATRDLSIVQSQNDVREPLRGGAEMVREQLFDVTFPRWFADGQPTIDGVRTALPDTSFAFLQKRVDSRRKPRIAAVDRHEDVPMTLPPLRDDALITDRRRVRRARLGLPWIRSLPLTLAAAT